MVKEILRYQRGRSCHLYRTSQGSSMYYKQAAVRGRYRTCRNRSDGAGSGIGLPMAILSPSECGVISPRPRPQC